MIFLSFQNGFTPLHVACKKNREQVIQLLLKYGANVHSANEVCFLLFSVIGYKLQMIRETLFFDNLCEESFCFQIFPLYENRQQCLPLKNGGVW